VATTGDTDADVDTSELVEADNQERLVKLFGKMSDIGPEFPSRPSIFVQESGAMYLEAEDLWLDEVERLAVNLDKTLSGLD
jgi:hypothetical protein